MHAQLSAAPVARRTCLALAAAAALLLAVSCHRDMVRLRVAPGSDDYQWQPIETLEGILADCTALEYRVEMSVGYGPGRSRPFAGFALNAQMQWNAAVRTVSDHAVALRELHNTAATTVEEFDAARSRMAQVVGNMRSQKLPLDAALADYAKAQAAHDQGPERPDPALKQTLDEARARAETAIGRAVELADSLPAY